MFKKNQWHIKLSYNLVTFPAPTDSTPRGNHGSKFYLFPFRHFSCTFKYICASIGKMLCFCLDICAHFHERSLQNLIFLNIITYTSYPVFWYWASYIIFLCLRFVFYLYNDNSNETCRIELLWGLGEILLWNSIKPSTSSSDYWTFVLLLL